jgi:2-iminobutanoate/2-iminopropanoate deaminase
MEMTIEYFAESNPGTRSLPRSLATKAGDFVFVSGQVARGEDGRIVAGGIEAHACQTLKNVAHVLALAGCTLKDVVKTTIWLEDARDFDEFNRVYGEFFGENKPSRPTVQARNMVGTKIADRVGSNHDLRRSATRVQPRRSCGDPRSAPPRAKKEAPSTHSRKPSQT